jgi:hypothetical protein
VRFVVKVGSDDRGIAPIPHCERSPVANPSRFGDSRRVPQLRLCVGIGAVTVEQNTQANLAGVSHDLIHYLKCVQPLQVGVFIIIDANRHIGAKDVVAPRQTNGVESKGLDLVHHFLVVT